MLALRLVALVAALSLLLAAPALSGAKSPKRQGKSHAHHKAKKEHAKRKGLKAPRKDPDHDGLNNLYEKRSGTNPHKADSDADGVPDGREDLDSDQVDNHTEQLARTNPRKADSDANGVADGAEDPDRDRLNNAGESQLGWHPRKRDSDHDGLLDGDEDAGVVSAVSDSSATIALAGGGSLTAAITEDTEMYCAGHDGDAASDDESYEDDGDFADDDDKGDDDYGDDLDDDFGDEDPGDDDDLRSARFAAADWVCTPHVGDRVYEAETDTWDGQLEFVTFDLIGD